MQLLKHRAAPFLVCLVVIVTGCAVWRQVATVEPLRFSHEKMLHQSLECADCHADTGKTAKAGMPSKETCLDCHENIDAQKPPEKGVASFFNEDGTFKAARVTAIPEEVKFSHKNHTIDHKVACAECHEGIPESTAITKAVRVTMAECIDCHEKTAKTATSRDEADKCATCHTSIRKDGKPASHAQNWIKFHGQKDKDGDQEGMNKCSLCHQQDSCTNCHNTMKPTNHTNHWRERGHGVTSALDRETCNTCHKSDFCTSCHKTTAPRTHRGQWGAPTDKHCVNCHIPVSGENCSTCHQQGTPSHNTAAPTPASMIGTNCRACHGVAPAAQLPHVDNGDDCNYCHR